MTRVNVVPVKLLSNKHLAGENYEIGRVVTTFENRNQSLKGVPNSYRMGEGHVLFFMDKLEYIAFRMRMLTTEMESRGYKPNSAIVFGRCRSIELFCKANKDQVVWRPRTEDFIINLDRLIEREPDNKKYIEFKKSCKYSQTLFGWADNQKG